MKFTRLTVTKEGPRFKGRRVFLCDCSCGSKNIPMLAVKLISQHTRSCGCLRSDSTKKTNTRYGQYSPALNSRIAQYRVAARKRNLAFEISQDQAAELMLGNCKYCGRPPQGTSKCRSHSIKTNGIDRIDSAVGYTYQNSVSCCGTCNLAKSDMAYEEWVRWMNDLVAFRSKSDSLGLLSKQDQHPQPTS